MYKKFVNGKYSLVQNMLQRNPGGKSCHRNGWGISGGTFNRITQMELRLHPYQIFPCHKLTEGDCANPWFLTDLLVGDEAAFAFNGKVNIWNVNEYTPVGGNPPKFNYDVRSLCQKLLIGEFYMVMSPF